MGNKKLKPTEILAYFKKIKGDKTSYTIILYNIFPIIGVLFFDWDPIAIVFIYIAETIVIGIFNLFKIFLSKKEIKQADGSYQKGGMFSKLFMAGFFFIHYNAFNYGQISIISSNIPGVGFFSGGLKYFYSYFLQNDSMLIALCLIIIFNMFSFFHNYIGGKQYEIYSPLTLLFLPYGRIFLQQFVGIVGAFFVVLFSLPFFFLIFLQIFKTAGELLTHVFLEDKLKDPIEFETN